MAPWLIWSFGSNCCCLLWFSILWFSSTYSVSEGGCSSFNFVSVLGTSVAVAFGGLSGKEVGFCPVGWSAPFGDSRWNGVVDGSDWVGFETLDVCGRIVGAKLDVTSYLILKPGHRYLQFELFEPLPAFWQRSPVLHWIPSLAPQLQASVSTDSFWGLLLCQPALLLGVLRLPRDC